MKCHIKITLTKGKSKQIIQKYLTNKEFQEYKQMILQIHLTNISHNILKSQ